MEIYADHGINWVWYLAVDTSDDNNAVTILAHYRLHCVRDEHPKKVSGRFELFEDDKRIVTGVRLAGGQKLDVINPQHIFSYK